MRQALKKIKKQKKGINFLKKNKNKKLKKEISYF